MGTIQQPEISREVGSIGSDEYVFQSAENKSVKRKLDNSDTVYDEAYQDKRTRRGMAPIKDEYLISHEDEEIIPKSSGDAADDDTAEAFHHKDRQPTGNNAKRREKNQGQNKARKFGSSKDDVGLCSTRTTTPEFSPAECRFGEKCKFEHNIRRYLAEHKREDLTTFGGLCPVWDVKGKCNLGWKCRFVGSHSTEILHSNGRKELVLVEDEERIAQHRSASSDDTETGVANAMQARDRILLTKKKFPLPRSEAYLKWLEDDFEQKGRPGENTKTAKSRNENPLSDSSQKTLDTENGLMRDGTDATAMQDNSAAYIEPALLPSEKRRLYFGPETPVLAPLTTQGNLPYRRLCASLGAAFTYSEMAMSLPLLQGQKSEWALIKAHESEVGRPPTFTMNNKYSAVYDYDQSQDMSFGAQIAANKPWACIKATEALTTLLPHGLRLVDLNVGCPIDLVYRDGAGSALMDSPGKLEKMLRGMNVVSGEVPITCKIRLGTKDKVPTAQKLCERLVLGTDNGFEHPCGVAAITLHGRSRQQRYTKQADWKYIADTAALIKRLNEKSDDLIDTIKESDERNLANGTKRGSSKVFFLGNGDVYSHVHYNQHIEEAKVDSVMVARGALIKPWIFEEIQSNQYLDKSASERLEYVEKFCRYGLEAWGSDEIGVGQTRRFLLEWLSFACRYVPIGLLEHLPPSIQDRPPRYKGRNELETLMASDNYKDWIKISEMFLGPAHKDFHFAPKHKSNSYEIQAEG